MNKLSIIEAGLVQYDTALNIQEDFLLKRINNEIEDSLILLEHPPTITLGRSGRTENLLVDEKSLSKHGIAFTRIKRGGDITYHGPGQIVGYPIIDLNNHEKDVHKYLRKLEEVLILTLKDFDINGRRIEKLTGVWVKRSKIASIGVAVRRWVTYHGFALNINTNLDFFDLMVPCGIQNVRMTSIKDWLSSNEDIDINLVTESIKNNFVKIFGFNSIVSKNLDTM